MNILYYAYTVSNKPRDMSRYKHWIFFVSKNTENVWFADQKEFILYVSRCNIAWEDDVIIFHFNTVFLITQKHTVYKAPCATVSQ